MLLPVRCTARRRAVLVVGVVACVLAGSSACTRRPPVAAPVPVALAVPPPPPRVISTPPERVAPTEASTVERPAPPARPQRATRAPARPEPTKAEAPKVDAVEAPSPAAAEAAPAPGPLLRTPQTADESNADRRTQEVLGRAVSLLDRVNPQALGTQARQQHETARRFVAQARQALTERNFVLAASLAEKAETLARGISR
ncbi:hypothetical protein [Luteitalea sp.]|uniref:hypothetical protein n=1 Tax=Luteitalea sp. TaxID=2004800 RepID=UPI0037C61357